MKKTILLILIIVLCNILRYYRWGNDLRSNQSYWIRELGSSSYKIIVYLIPALILFRAYRHQSRTIYRTKKQGICALVLFLCMVIGKVVNEKYLWIETSFTLLTLPYVLITNSVIEEYVFRGILLSKFSKSYSFRTANILQSCCFGLIHLPFYMRMWKTWISLTFALWWVSILWLRRWYVKKQTNGLFSPVLLHSVRNGVLIFG